MTQLQTFRVPADVTGTRHDAGLGRAMVRAWQVDGIFQVETDPAEDRATARALDESRRFFRLPPEVKARHFSDLSYSGYGAPGSDVTASQADRCETFTVCQDVASEDHRVPEQWPWHGPVPWPDAAYRRAMRDVMRGMGSLGDRLLRLTALGLGLGPERVDALTGLTFDGWHHLRVLRCPARSAGTSRGTGEHTSYGLLVLAAQHEAGGLSVRPPIRDERGDLDRDPWRFVPPVPGTFTALPGDVMRFLTGGALPATPHRVQPAQRERFALTYFHEPNLAAVVRPLHDPNDGYPRYGTHSTDTFTHSHPQRAGTRRIAEEDRLATLDQLRERGDWYVA